MNRSVIHRVFQPCSVVESDKQRTSRKHSAKQSLTNNNLWKRFERSCTTIFLGILLGLSSVRLYIQMHAKKGNTQRRGGKQAKPKKSEDFFIVFISLNTDTEEQHDNEV